MPQPPPAKARPGQAAESAISAIATASKFRGSPQQIPGTGSQPSAHQGSASRRSSRGVTWVAPTQSLEAEQALAKARATVEEAQRRLMEVRGWPVFFSEALRAFAL